MIPRARLWLSFTLAFGVLIVGAGAVPLCLVLARPGLERLAEARQVMATERLRSADLDEQMRKVQERTAAKDGIIQDLVACRMTLAEAAEGFRRLHEEASEPINDLPFCRPGASDGERLRRLVIAWAASELTRYPASQARATLRRLRAELRAYLNHESSPAPASHHRI